LLYGVFYSSSVVVLLFGYTYYDLEGDSFDRLSSVGYIFQLGLGPNSRSSKKVKTLSLSSCKAEYREAKEATKEVIWL